MELFRNNLLGLRDTITHNRFIAASPEAPQNAGNGTEDTILIGSIGQRLERYVSLIGRHIDNNGNILFLLPDHYAAGAYFAREIKAIYGERVLWSSSGVPVKQRMETYFRARHEGGHVILGNKGSVFLPARNLSLIIVERYDDDEYRNEESFQIQRGPHSDRTRPFPGHSRSFSGALRLLSKLFTMPAKTALPSNAMIG